MLNVMSLKKQLQKKKTIDDLILAIIYKANPNERIPKSNAYLQKAFFDIKDKSKGLLDFLLFDCSSYIPYSEKLDEALFRLEASNILPTLNPSYQNYSLVGKQEVLISSFNKFNKKEKTIIKNLGLELEKIINKDVAI